MTKAKKNERGKVKLGLNDLTDETRIALDDLDAVVSSYGDMMSIKDLSNIVELVKDECGEDAEISVHIDDYFGNSVDITWYRSETDEEWAKRLEANKKRSVAAREQRKAEKVKKEIKERADLVRLQKKYSKKT